MVTKRCAYRGCRSYIGPTHPCSETFYAFPKDPERCKMWMELGACTKDVPPTMRYFCSKHFDETKYVAQNQRRKQLLSSAIPWPYDHSHKKNTPEQEIDYQCVESTIDDNDGYDDENGHIETFNTDPVAVEFKNDFCDISEDVDALHSYEYHEITGDTEFIGVTMEKKNLKRKQEVLVRQSQSQPTSTDVVVVPLKTRASSSTVPERPQTVKVTEEIDETKMSESSEPSNITTFIFKGQEYIQMPKEEYVQEKFALVQKIKVYEDILRNMKQLMDDVDL